MSLLGGATGRIDIDAGGATRGVNQANASLASLERAVATNWWGIRNLGLAFAALPALVGIGVASIVKAASEFESAMAGVARTTQDAGATAEQNRVALGHLRQEILEIANTRPIATVEIAGIAEAAGALGVAQQDIASFTTTVVDMAATTDATSDEIAPALARIAAATGTTAAGYDNLASGVLKAGITTAATEKDILSLSQKVAASGSIYGLTASQVIGYSAAIRTAGVNTAEGATAFAKTFHDLNAAVQEGGTAADTLVALTGMSKEAFASLFQEDSSAAMEKFINGLGRLAGDAAATNNALGSLGIVEARQVKTLALLAKFQSQNVNENFKMSQILKVTEQATLDGNVATDAARERYKTLASQVQIARNNLFELKVLLGTGLLGPIKAIVDRFTDFIVGLKALPGPVKGVISIFFGLLTLLSAIAAIILLVGARLIIAFGAFRQLAGGGTAAAGAMGQAGAAMGQAASQADRLKAAEDRVFMAQMRAARMAEMKAKTSGKAITASAAYKAAVDRETQAIIANDLAMAKSQARMASYSKWLGRVGRGFGALMSVAIIASIGIGAFGNDVKNAEDKVAKLSGATKELTDALRAEAKGAKGAADAAILNSKAYQEAKVTADQLGISQERLLALIKGVAGTGDYKAFIDQVNRANEDGVKGAENLLQTIHGLMLSFRASAGEAGVNVRPLKDTGAAAIEAADAIEQLSEKQAEAAEKTDKMSQAHIELADALFKEHEAAYELSQAQDALNEIREKDLAADIAKHERDLTKARVAQQRASRDLVKAQKALNRARAAGLEALADAEDDLASTQDRYLDSLDKVQELEEDLAELRRGPELGKLRDATNDLKNAELSLLRAHQSVRDAEWQLQYLREEGASNRDIEDAELALGEARQEVNNVTDEYIDAQEELSALLDETARQEAIADMERELAAARREVASASRDITESEQELADIRDQVANDTFYLDALEAVQDAQFQVADAIDATREAEIALQKIKAEGYAKETEAANNQLEQALYAVARANVEITKQQALLRGETFNAGKEAHATADELTKLLGLAPSPEARKRMEEYIATLRKAPIAPDPPKGGGGGGGGDEGAAPPPPATPLGDADPFGDAAEKAKGSLSTWEFIKQNLLTIFLGISAASSIMGTGVVKSIGKMVVSAAGELANLGAKAAYSAAGVVDDVARIGASAGRAAITFVADTGRMILGWVRLAAASVASAATQAASWAVATAGSMARAVASMAVAVATTVAGWITMAASALAGAASVALAWLISMGPIILLIAAVALVAFLVVKYWDEIVAGAKWLWEWIKKIFDWVIDFLWNAFLNFTPLGNLIKHWDTVKAAASAVWEWVKDMFGKLIDFLTNAFMNYTPLGFLITHWDTIKDAARATWEWVRDRFTDLLNFFRELPGKIFGFFQGIHERMFNIGRDLIQGLWNGIQDVVRPMVDWIQRNVIDKIKDAPVIGWAMGSPSRLYRDYGGFLMEGLEQGMAGGLGDVTKVVNDIVDAASLNLKPTVDFGTGVDMESPAMKAVLRPSPVNVADLGLPANTMSTITNTWQFNLEAHTDANASELMNEFVFAHQIATRD